MTTAPDLRCPSNRGHGRARLARLTRAAARVAVLAACLVPASCAAPVPPAPTAPEPVHGASDPACAVPTAPVDRIRIGLPGYGMTRALGNAALADALSRNVGLPVDVLTFDAYEALAEGIRSGSLEAAVLPPLEYVRAHERSPCLAARLTSVYEGQVHYSAYLVVRKGSGLTDLRQLAGRSVAFVDQSSASGWLFPVARLAEFAIDPFRDLSEVLFLGTHRAVIQAVLSGRVDAGATYPGALEMARRDGIDTGALTLLGIAGRIPYDALVVRPTLDPGQVRTLLEAFAALNTTTDDGRAALATSDGASGWVATTDGFYDEVREVLRLVKRFGGGTP